ncbi:MAG: Aldehyde ferredoxin oxidoreductase [Deltaproteobacteria bacterium]|nr:Aldehyde ferredoxin oxidoreductase [Deltaproteobacteria bacterium]
MGKGYTGKILNVDLTSGTTAIEQLPDSIYEQYLGGYGLGARILFDRVPAGADPLGHDNILGFVPGLLTGTGALFAGRWMVVGKSPLTGGWGDANCGGDLGPDLKKAGFDGIFVRGIASKPVYLLVDRGTIALRDAGHLWGLDAIDTEARLKEELGNPFCRVAAIGQAGERLSLISGIVNDRGRLAARSGLGAVMGSKKLKAVVVRGNERVAELESTEVEKVNREFLERMAKAEEFTLGVHFKAVLECYGTSGITAMSSETGDSPVKNWGGVGHADFPIGSKSWKIGGEEVIRYQTKRYKCSLCPLGCGGELSVDEPGCKLPSTRKPEHQTLASFGAMTLVDDLPTIFMANEMCNRAGLDSISAGSSIAFAIECFENGILTAQDTGGLELRWGDASIIRPLLEKIIAREGIGDMLADGVRIAAEKIGKGAERFAMHVGGQELPMHDPRHDPGLGVAYRAEATPGRHTIASLAYGELMALEEKFPWLGKSTGLGPRADSHTPSEGELLAVNTAYTNAANGAGLCLFGLSIGGKIPLSEWINAATGWDKSNDEYLEIGHRILALRHAFSLREGIDPRSIRLPDRVVGKPPVKDGPPSDMTIDHEALLQDYYRNLEWDPVAGRPSHDRYRRLGLGDVAAVVCQQ